MTGIRSKVTRGESEILLSSFVNRQLKEAGHTFLQNQNAVQHAGGLGFPLQKLQRFVYRLVGEAEGAVVHGHHPARTQVEKGAHRVCRAGVHVAKSGRIVGADGEQRQVRVKLTPNFAETGKIGGVAGVVNGVAFAFQNVAAVTAVRVLDNARAPVPGRHAADGKPVVTVLVPPVQFHNFAETQVGDQVVHVAGNDDDRRDRKSVV